MQNGAKKHLLKKRKKYLLSPDSNLYKFSIKKTLLEVCDEKLLYRRYHPMNCPSFKPMQYDSENDTCPYCGNVSFLCHKVIFGEYCIKAVQMHNDWIGPDRKPLSLNGGHMHYVTYYNCALLFVELGDNQFTMKFPIKNKKIMNQGVYPPICMEIHSMKHMVMDIHWKQRHFENTCPNANDIMTAFGNKIKQQYAKQGVKNLERFEWGDMKK